MVLSKWVVPIHVIPKLLGIILRTCWYCLGRPSLNWVFFTRPGILTTGVLDKNFVLKVVLCSPLRCIILQSVRLYWRFDPQTHAEQRATFHSVAAIKISFVSLVLPWLHQTRLCRDCSSNTRIQRHASVTSKFSNNKFQKFPKVQPVFTHSAASIFILRFRHAGSCQTQFQ